MEEKVKEQKPRAINFGGKRRMLCSVKGWEIITIRSSAQGRANQQLINKLKITLAGKEIIEYTPSDMDEIVMKLDTYFGLL